MCDALPRLGKHEAAAHRRVPIRGHIGINVLLVAADNRPMEVVVLNCWVTETKDIRPN
jgi:hypothetical protein